jgi:nitroimidazol reductase NimA-like FMN-containing flavoprotein (pyridoxamine 5'-phosphate oxidase superfamily)
MNDTDRTGPVTDVTEPTDHTGMRVLTLQDCLARLGSAPVGRVAFALDGEIAVLPVNHTLDGLDICFRTAGGSKIQAAIDGDRVSFEVDGFDPARRWGWSVLVHGTAGVVVDEQEMARLVAISRPPWVSMDAPSTRWIRISTREVTGRETLGS